MTAFPMSDLPTISTQHKDSSIIISEATIQFIESGCHDIDALEKRAKAFANCARPDLALHDAYEIIRLAPLSSIGHTLAGWAHTQYGQQEKAIHHYNHALTIETNLDRRNEIQESRHYNEQQLSKRVDFVCELPFELVSSLILPRTLEIVSHAALTYLHVCKRWRQCVLQTTQLQFTSMFKSRPGAMELLVAYAPHIQKITLSYYASFPLQYVSSTRFPSLTWLSLRFYNSRDISYLYAFLQSSGGTLKDMYLKVGHHIQHGSVRLDAILRHCPNLEVFNSNKVYLSPLEHTYTKVKKLWIESMVHPLSENNIIALVQHLPALKHIRLPRCEDSRALPMMHLHCPTLRTLAYSTTPEAVVVYHEYIIIKEQGLHSLTVEGDTGLRLQDLALTLTAFSSTLVNIDLSVDTTYEESTPLALDPNVRFERLRNLVVCIHDGDRGKDLVRWILKHASNTRTVYAPPYNMDEPAIYETMKGMNHLTSIASLAPSTTMIGLMEYHGSLGNASTLRKVKIGFNYNGDQRERILNAICQLHRLESLTLHVHGSGLGDDFVAYMERLGEECPYLQELELHACHLLPHEIIATLPMYTNLEYLTVHSPNTWDECLLDLLECPSLVSVDIPEESMDMDVAEALEDLLS